MTCDLGVTLVRADLGLDGGWSDPVMPVCVRIGLSGVGVVSLLASSSPSRRQDSSPAA
jgi:hypothetical protein